MKTIDDILDTLKMQYMVEAFHEQYEKATVESDKYFLKAKFLISLDEEHVPISDVISYMMLQPEKFNYMLTLLRDVRVQSRRKTVAKKPKKRNSIIPDIQVFVCAGQGEDDE